MSATRAGQVQVASPRPEWQQAIGSEGNRSGFPSNVKARHDKKVVLAEYDERVAVSDER
jgi:hypothetical protein